MPITAKENNMSLMLNNVIIAGNITGEIELKEVGSNCVASFSMALNEKYKKADGSTEEKVNFIDVEAWGKTGEFIKNYFSKGKGICITGSLAQDRWDDATSGQKRSKIKVKAFKADFTDSKGDSGNSGAREVVQAPIQEAAAVADADSAPF
jgi:single-strand DNA-binding protein